MKYMDTIVKWVGTSVLGFWLAGCAAPNTQKFVIESQIPEIGPRFHDERAVNAVLQFSSWDFTFLVRPQYLENGFLQQVHPDDIGQVFDRMKVQRGMAVVVVNCRYNGQELDKLVTDWKSILGGCGFQRVVILRAQIGDQLNGSIVIDDSTLHLGSAENGSHRG